MTLQQASTPALRRPAKRRDKRRLWQEMAMIAPAVLLLAI
ncbi:sugar ABC transporter permease, partial [Rhizobium ruizarguesonis]